MKRWYTSVILFILLLVISPCTFAKAAPPRQFEAPIEQGRYIATIAGCTNCHTARDGQLLAGGDPFELGPLGRVYPSNLTPDEATGIGSWSDEELKMAIRIGISPDGLHQFPIMPYALYNNMADSDLDAVIAYLRSVPAVSNEVPREQILLPETLPQLPMQEGIEAVDSSNLVMRGEYLFSGVLGCTDCHTPIDAETGAPIMTQYLAGGQPYEGPWGIVYASNLTPHAETGLAEWRDEEIELVLRAGIRPDGRRVVLMPWEDTAALTAQDMEAVLAYLRNLPAVENEVPAPAITEAFTQFVDVPMTPEAAFANGVVPLILIILALLGAFVAGQWMSRR